MQSAIIIPARYASTRLPGKPLLNATGKFLIQHVYERACQARATRVIVATDDQRIFDAVQGFGGEAMMTRDDHPSGTDRVAEVARQLDADIIVNLQGDEPQVDPASLDLLADMLQTDADSDLATLAVPIRNMETWRDPNCVKVVCDAQGRALYFSRSPIPYVRDAEPDFSRRPTPFLQHLGLYAYRKDFLLQLAHCEPEPIELLEKLEQLRVLALGRRIAVGIVEHAGRGIDTPADYEQFLRTHRKQAA